MVDNTPAAEQVAIVPQAEQSTDDSTNHAPASTARRHLLGPVGRIAGVVLATVVALGAARGTDASQLRTGSTHQPRPQGTEQPSPTPSTSQGEHLVPVPPEDCEYPWKPNTQPEPTHPPVGDNNGMVLASMKKPAPKETQGTEECWVETPDGSQTTTQNSTTNAQPEAPQSIPTVQPPTI